MAISHTKTQIINNALRMVGSYHIEDGDTTSTTYQIADRAFEDAANDVFSTNIFQYNTARTYSTGIETATLSDADKPGSGWSHRHVLPDDYNLLIGVSNTAYTSMLDFTLDGISGSSVATIPYLFTTEEKVHIFYTFVPSLDDSANTGSVHRMPSYLARLLSLHMAQNMSIELSGSENRHEILFKQYTLALRRARTLEGRSSPPMQYISDTTSSFVNAHQNYGSI
jgi:hypothetical protein